MSITGNAGGKAQADNAGKAGMADEKGRISETRDPWNYKGKAEASQEKDSKQMSEIKRLCALVQRRTILKKQFSTDPSNAWLRNQISSIGDEIHKIDPGFELEEPAIDWTSIIYDKGRRLKSHMAKNAGAYLLFAVVIAVGGLAVVANYTSRKINEYRQEQAAFSKNIDLFNKRLDSTDEKARAYERKFRDATARLNAAHELFISEVYSITEPLSAKLNGLESKIGKIELEQYEQYNAIADETKAGIEELQGSIDSAFASLNELSARITSLSSDKDNQYIAVCSEVDALGAKLYEMSSSLSEYVEKAGKEAETNKGLADSLNALSGSIKEIKSEYQSSINALNAKVKQLENERDKSDKNN